jgi:hypothetical protein
MFIVVGIEVGRSNLKISFYVHPHFVYGRVMCMKPIQCAPGLHSKHPSVSCSIPYWLTRAGEKGVRGAPVCDDTEAHLQGRPDDVAHTQCVFHLVCDDDDGEEQGDLDLQRPVQNLDYAQRRPERLPCVSRWQRVRV